ncbi:hypothetical protein [Myceligenerans pegani]|uniref:Uncharacterized protein n=1 Tax=Myceligenerans pegani TaxID=2776917 RepID=A0ABR9MY43_9MICO|nr:hypothetical protein [Myceligenerans sp. TRM 65318]MBE1876287.1 hypothetical protein [Myceligenerans sp. TRM 65318]MBE3018558.1 hypothetical protein [Myceligenerans sp. TRM 65318]
MALDGYDDGFGAWRRRRVLGMDPLVLVVVLPLLGLGYVMVTMPALFGAAGRLPAVPEFAQAVLNWLGTFGHGLSAAAAAVTDTPIGSFLLGAAFVALPATWLAAGIRSVRGGSVRPAATAVVGGVTGLLLVPAVTWLAYLAVRLWEFVVANPVLALLLYLTVVLGIHVVLAVATRDGFLGGILILLGTIGLCVLWLLVPEIAEFVEAHLRYFVAAAVAVPALVMAGVVRATGDSWAGSVFFLAGGAVVAAFVLFAWGLIVAIAALAFGLAILGYTVWLAYCAGGMTFGPVYTARRAGTGRGGCLDTSAGIGAGVGLMLLAASLDPTFHETLADAWPALGTGGPFPTLWFPDAIGQEIAPAVEGFVVVADGGLLAVVTTLAVVSLLARTEPWDDDVRSVVLVPLLTTTGWMVLGLFLAWFANRDDD